MDITLAGGALTYQPNDDQLGRLSIELAAFDGEVGIGQLPVPDPAAAINVASGRRAMVEEGAALLIDGFILDHDRDRGVEPTGTARDYVFSVSDANALLGGFRVVRSRGVETDYARVMAFAALDGPSWDTTMVINASTYTLPAKDYDGDGGWGELITDMIEFTGKTFFLHDKADGSGRCLHYHVLSGGHTCGLAISDDPADQDATTFYPWLPHRARTAVDLVNDIKGRDQEGRTSLASDATSIAAHDADGLQHQALIDFEAGSQADLDAKTAAFLANQKDERDSYTCSIGPLDEDALALIRVGDRITVTSTVMGLTASVKRISHMTLTVLQGQGSRTAPWLWMAALEMDAPVRRRSRVKPSLKGVIIPPGTTIGTGSGPGNADCCMDPWVCSPTDFLVPIGEAANLIISDPTFAGEQYGVTFGGIAPPFFTLYAGATYFVDVTVFHSVSPEAGWLNAVGVHGSGESQEFDMGGAPNHLPGLVNADGYFTPTTTSSDFTTILRAVNTIANNSYTSTAEIRVKYVSGPDPRYVDLPPCTNPDPLPGQPIAPTTFVADGTTTDYATDWPIQHGSIYASVDGLDWADRVIEEDLATGNYAFDYPPAVGSNVRVGYNRGD